MRDMFTYYMVTATDLRHLKEEALKECRSRRQLAEYAQYKPIKAYRLDEVHKQFLLISDYRAHVLIYTSVLQVFCRHVDYYLNMLTPQPHVPDSHNPCPSCKLCEQYI